MTYHYTVKTTVTTGRFWWRKKLDDFTFTDLSFPNPLTIGEHIFFRNEDHSTTYLGKVQDVDHYGCTNLQSSSTYTVLHTKLHRLKECNAFENVRSLEGLRSHLAPVKI